MHLVFLILLSLSWQVIGQETNSAIVYAGRNFTWGMNMGSYDLAILLRGNGTFCESLDAPEWQTKIDGVHKKIKEGILLEYRGKTTENDTIFIEKDALDGYEDIRYGGAQMIKMKLSNTIPEGYYTYKTASNTGGMGTGMAYVGTQHYDGIRFYENGTFKRSASGGVVVSDRAIGGGTSSNTTTDGRYTIDKGLLTLVSADGKVVKHSFFYGEPDDDGTFAVAMNGALFFSESTDGEKFQNLNDENNNATAVRLTIPEVNDIDVLQRIKLAHGGGAIDSIIRTEVIMETSGLEFKVLLDVERKFLRLESLSPTFPYVEQLEGESGWLFQNGVIQELPDTRVAEMKNTFYSGLFLLQSPILNRIKVLDVRDNGKGFKILKLDLDGTISGMVMDTETDRLVGTAKFNDLGNEITLLSDFREVDGILIPFKEEIETDGQNIVIQNKTYTINPVWDSTIWQRPD